ncbi:MAG TPA: glycosyltransferase family 4 protein [Dehalococcoidia bacterium]|nr:glycosyltransferase family 4 protein [Dehalococcoidia bacterium]
MRICLLSYRGNPYSGGQGIYVYYLSRELQNLGHEVHVLSGPPYPEVIDGVTIHKLESLNLYESTNSVWQELPRLRNPLRFYEFLAVSLGTFPEPFTFSIRAFNRLRALQSEIKFDVIHDNQSLGWGLLLMKRLKVPVVATIHHPIPVDRQLALAQAEGLREQFRLRKFYSFIGMQKQVAQRLDRVITVSENSAQDINRILNVRCDAIRIVLNGVDTDYFDGNGHIPKEANSLIMVSSGNGHIKGLPFLLEALHIVRQETPAKLTVVGNGTSDDQPNHLVQKYGLEDAVTFTGKIEKDELAKLYASSEIAVVPSLYEGFGLPAAEAMSCGLPIVSTSAGALPEVVGEDGKAGFLVPPADPDNLAVALKRLLSDKQLGKSMGDAGRKRVLENFSWQQTALNTVRVYEELLDAHGRL